MKMPDKRAPKSMALKPQMPKHLPFVKWPEADRTAFATIFAEGDLFDDDRPTGAHLSRGTRRHIKTGWSRWLGFLLLEDRDALALLPLERLNRHRMRALVDHLATEVRQTTIASNLDAIYQAARLMAPHTDWSWLKNVQRRIAQASQPLDRQAGLVEPSATLDLGLRLMDTAKLKISTQSPDPWMRGETSYRDGLLLVLVTLWPIRRRSLAALTISRHIQRQGETFRFQLFQEDTKAKRAETFVFPDRFAAYLAHYLKTIRPRLARSSNQDAFWISDHGSALTGDGLYQIVRRTTKATFSRPMNLHDFRRSAATFIAMEVPHMVGIVSGVLQHAGSTTAEQHYNLANSVEASKRYGNVVAQLKAQSTKDKSNQYHAEPIGQAGRLTDLPNLPDSPNLFFCSKGTKQ